MRLEATIELSNLQKVLPGENIPADAILHHGEDEGPAASFVHLGAVEIDDDDALQALRDQGRAWSTEDDFFEPPEAQALEDWLNALLSRDMAMAAALSDRVFSDDGSRAVCDRMLSRVRRAA